MLRSKHIEKICCIALALTLILTCGFMGAAASGMIEGERLMGYEARLFDQSRVHTLELVMDDWDGFLETCRNEEYAVCSVVIDGESYKNVAIRAKGNTSLSSVDSYGNNRYSFKIEFDHYENGKSYHGLDKLSLNNLIQDTTRMKDYIAYTLMGKMGVAAPLCSFVEIKVNGEYWGLYLAVEGVEESFLARNFGSDYGDLYKPDSLSFGGGRGNGMNFDMNEMKEKFGQMQEDAAATPGMQPSAATGEERMEMPGGMQKPDFSGFPGGGNPWNGGNRGGMGAMGSSDVMLQYSDDNPESYANIFDSAKTDVTENDQQRLIGALKKLSAGDASAANQEQVIRYLAVHHFLCNDDSYTGSMIHNYYLYEENGALSMIPWDYNLAFGSFSMGGSFGATSVVNRGIDSPVSSGDISSRPILSWIFSGEENKNRYHEIYRELLENHLENGWLENEISRVSALIAPYVENDPTSFYSYEQFTTGIETMREFCSLRTKSIRGQLDGIIPATTEAQNNSSLLIDASYLNLSDMGSMGNGGGGRMEKRNGFEKRSGNQTSRKSEESEENIITPAPTEAASETSEIPAPPEMRQNPFMGIPGSMNGNVPPSGMGQMGNPPQSGFVPGVNGGMPAELPLESLMPAEAAAPTPAPQETKRVSTAENVSGQQTDEETITNRLGSRSNAFDLQTVPPDRNGVFTPNSNSDHWILLGASVVILAIALVITKFSKGNYH